MPKNTTPVVINVARTTLRVLPPCLLFADRLFKSICVTALPRFEQHRCTILRQPYKRLNVRDYNFVNDPARAKTTGFIAQQLNELFAGAVSKNGDNGPALGKLNTVVCTAVRLRRQSLEWALRVPHDACAFER